MLWYLLGGDSTSRRWWDPRLHTGPGWAPWGREAFPWRRAWWSTGWETHLQHNRITVNVMWCELIKCIPWKQCNLSKAKYIFFLLIFLVNVYFWTFINTNRMRQDRKLCGEDGGMVKLDFFLMAWVRFKVHKHHSSICWSMYTNHWATITNYVICASDFTLLNHWYLSMFSPQDLYYPYISH